jgi:hypothetical protein
MHAIPNTLTVVQLVKAKKLMREVQVQLSQ